MKLLVMKVAMTNKAITEVTNILLIYVCISADTCVSVCLFVCMHVCECVSAPEATNYIHKDYGNIVQVVNFTVNNNKLITKVDVAYTYWGIQNKSWHMNKQFRFITKVLKDKAILNTTLWIPLQQVVFSVTNNLSLPHMWYHSIITVIESS